MFRHDWMGPFSNSNGSYTYEARRVTIEEDINQYAERPNDNGSINSICFTQLLQVFQWQLNCSTRRRYLEDSVPLPHTHHNANCNTVMVFDTQMKK